LVVVDASAVAALLFNQRSTVRLRERLAEETALHAPHLLDLEVTQVLRRALRRGHLTEAGATARLADLEALRLLRYPHDPFLKRIWELRASLTAYDAAYVALAEALAAPLITLDRPLSLAPGHQAAVEFYGETH
jgi:predicted nucleic acid-binding protein